MGFLRYFDYLRLIQDVNLKQLITGDDSNRVLTEQAAQTEMIGYLAMKYDTAEAFRDTVVYDPTLIYNGNQLVELNFDDYNATSGTYTADVSCVIYNGDAYICKTTIVAAEPFDNAKWTKLGKKYDLFYIPTPYPVFNIKSVYDIGDVVFWKNKIYTCKQATIVPDHGSNLQRDEITNILPYNIIPDDPNNGIKAWGVGVSYSFKGLNTSAKVADFPAWVNSTTYAIGDRVSSNNKMWEALAASTNKTPGEDITNWQSIAWTLGDNRNPLLVQKMCYMVLYYLGSRIPARNVPEVWITRYRDTIEWLDKGANAGVVIVDLPLIQKQEDTFMRYGGKVKNKNSY